AFHVTGVQTCALPIYGVLVVERRQVSGTTNRTSQLRSQVRVQPVRVGPGELLRHSDDHGQLDRREHLRGSELDTLKRLLRTLTRSQRGSTDLTRLRVSVVGPHNVLVHANRDLATQAQQQRLVLGLGENVTHDLPRKAVGVQTMQVTLVVAVVSSRHVSYVLNSYLRPTIARKD